MTQEQILQIHSKKHVKIYLLNKEGVKDKAIAELLGTNVGHVYNVLKDYASNPEKAEKASHVAPQHKAE